MIGSGLRRVAGGLSGVPNLGWNKRQWIVSCTNDRLVTTFIRYPFYQVCRGDGWGDRVCFVRIVVVKKCCLQISRWFVSLGLWLGLVGGRTGAFELPNDRTISLFFSF